MVGEQWNDGMSMQRNTMNGTTINTSMKQSPIYVTKQKERSMEQCLRHAIIGVKKLYAYTLLHMHIVIFTEYPLIKHLKFYTMHL